MSHQESVKHFMTLMGQYPTPKVDTANPSEQDLEITKLRLKLIIEEVSEMFEAFVKPKIFEEKFKESFEEITKEIAELETANLAIDRVEVMDAITDQDYINSGTAVWLDLPLEDSFAAVHANNLTKVDPVTGLPIRREDGKIIKPSTYIPVDLKGVLEAYDSRS